MASKTKSPPADCSAATGSNSTLKTTGGNRSAQDRTVTDRKQANVNPADVIQLADVAGETIEITELEPSDGTFIGKRINDDGSITDYPLVTWWWQSVAIVPATIPHLFAYLRAARERNICLISGAPANLERQPTLKRLAHQVMHGKMRGDHGFVDAPTRLFFLDLDGAPVSWKSNPEKAIRSVLDLLGEPWSSTSFVWFFSAGHGLEKKDKRWTGKIVDGNLRARIAFITDRALIDSEAAALTRIVKAKVPEFCTSLRTVQPNYIKRPLWVEHPNRDPLGDIATIGRFEGKFDYLSVPDDLAHQARWAKAQGHNVDIAEHPDAETAMRAIGVDGSIRSHLMSAMVHLLNANPIPETVSFSDHAIAVVSQLQNMLDQHRDEIVANLAVHGRGWGDVLHYLPDNMIDWAHWLLDHPSALRRKTIKLIKDETPQQEEEVTLEAICARVARAFERVRKGKSPDPNLNNPYSAYERFAEHGSTGTPLVELIAAPTGSRKSTLMRATAVAYVRENPEKSVAILMPRHRLGDEQIDALMKEHQGDGFVAAVWRGRQAWDPEIGDGKQEKMCQRADEAKELEDNLVNVDSHLCKRGRGEKQVKCPLFDVCGYQRQKRIEANIWFAAHECMVHEMPKAFGDVGLLMIDENSLDAFMFGVNDNDRCEIALDKLLDPPTREDVGLLINARKKLHALLSKLKPTEHVGAPISLQSLEFEFKDVETPAPPGGKGTIHMRRYDPRELASLEWRCKVEPDIRPNMTKAQMRKELLKAADNTEVKTRATLWELIDLAIKDEVKLCGRVQVRRDKKNGRIISLVGLRKLAKGWQVQTVICDATGDVELLRAVWPQIEAEDEPWPQLPRPASVRVFQIVDRSISKWAVAVEGKSKEELERKGDAARRMYAALLLKAMDYGGADVAAITYKSTEEWIKANCFVPPWLKLAHHGDVSGTNTFANVAALFEIGRMQPPPEAMVRQAEALFGKFIPQREYKKVKARIPIVQDEEGHNSIEVALYQHKDPMVRRLLWQAREGAVVQTGGRARAGLRDAATPLDMFRCTDVPVPELGLVEPLLWSEVDAGLDGLMLAAGGVWLECIPDAVKAYAGLLTVNGLRTDRKSKGEKVFGTPFHYRRGGQGLERGFTLRNPEETKAWLEEKLGPLKSFAIGGASTRKAAK